MTLAPPPQLTGSFVTDGGLETWLIFQEGIELPSFAAFVLLADDEGRAALRRYYDHYLRIARDHGTGLELLSPTWRANPDWGEQLGYTQDQLDRFNHDAVRLMHEIAPLTTVGTSVSAAISCMSLTASWLYRSS